MNLYGHLGSIPAESTMKKKSLPRIAAVTGNRDFEAPGGRWLTSSCIMLNHDLTRAIHVQLGSGGQAND